MTKGIIYYTDNRLDEPIFSIVQSFISKANLPIVSVSLKPISFGNNFVLKLSPGYPSMIRQITKALEESESDYVFFCEHDILYPLSHFDFIPKKNDIFYYNANVWRWQYPKDRAITYDRLINLSSLCVNREFALDHYKRRLAKVEEVDWGDVEIKNPRLARLWGYEPGTKKIKDGGFSDDNFETWKSRDPIIDIRHDNTFSLKKVTFGAFVNLPNDWRETTLDKIPGWNLNRLFNL